MKHSLVWYRNDLRTLDHEPLTRAIQFSAASGTTQRGGNVGPVDRMTNEPDSTTSEPGSVYCLYCFDDQQWESTHFGFPKTGVHRTRFLIESVQDLRERIRRLGGDLIVRRGRPAKAIKELSTTLDIAKVFYHEEVGTEEQAVERSVQNLCKGVGIEWRSYQGETLFHPDELPFTIAELPELFTQFRKQLEKSSKHRLPLPEPTRIPGELPSIIAPGTIPTIEDLLVSDRAADSVSRSGDSHGSDTPTSDDPPPRPTPCPHRKYTGGQSAGLDRIDEYVWRHDRLRIYKETRNGMLNVDDSSKLSLWLANGSLSPRTIAAEVDRYEDERVANQSTYWMVFELLWRDYFHFITAKHGKRLFQVGGIQRRKIPWDRDARLFEAWKNGQTGYPLVDANMRELAATGIMSNRGRQNVGSFLCKNLGLDWRMGAEWFESQLLDYAPASNYGNWNYVAGVGNDARGFRFFNITKQSRDYDPDGAYVRHWLPELAQVPNRQIHEPWKLTAEEQQRFGVTLGRDYPLPIVDLFASARANEEKYKDF